MHILSYFPVPSTIAEHNYREDSTLSPLYSIKVAINSVKATY
jgi:hypothetical protein